MNSEFPELHDFFGAYFHQDWTAEHQTSEQVIDAFLTDSGSLEVRNVRQELGLLLNQRMDEPLLKEFLLRELSCYYCYWNEWESGQSWLRHIFDRLKGEI
ncbi:contact-dependent growth inhibition system immunity protein [Pseudomonas sp. Irchel 3A7]|uniref:contact-dependent growth inhibition system immunity protein n=1 Tax=Pseudomonas sp. Irchel 3A7 TaxID=2008913 RepID=UPI000BA369F4|nr:contact-dependent growth inhibition system immunity protein [Pseudomonas sp. Irchel 3A7]